MLDDLALCKTIPVKPTSRGCIALTQRTKNVLEHSIGLIILLRERLTLLYLISQRKQNHAGRKNYTNNIVANRTLGKNHWQLNDKKQ